MVKKVLVPINTDVIIKEKKVAVKNPDGSISWTTEYITNPAPNLKYIQLKAEYSYLIKDIRENDTESEYPPGEEFVGGMPVQLEKGCLKNLLQTDQKGNYVYQMTLKVDGERFLLFIGRDGIVYLIDRSVNFYYFVQDSGEMVPFLDPSTVKPFLFDGELIYHKETKVYEYIIFDCLYYQGDSFISKNYSGRYSACVYAYNNVLKKYFQKISNSLGELTVSVKIWYSITAIAKEANIYKFIANATNKSRPKNSQLISDGIVLQPFDQPYIPYGAWNKFRNIQFKWKPSDQLTLDFKIKIYGPNEWHLLTKTDQEYAVKQADGTNLPAICIPSETQKGKYHDSEVVEFKLAAGKNLHKNIFIPIRPRHEKDANSYNTIMSTLNVINNPFNLDELKPAFIAKSSLSKILNIYSESDLILCCLNNFFTKKETKQIKIVYDKYLSEDPLPELEFRIFKHGKTNGVLDKFTFYYLYDYLKKYFDYTTNETVDISENKPTESRKFRSTYRKISDVPVIAKNDTVTMVNEYKEKLVNYMFEPTKSGYYNNLSFKLETSREIPIVKAIGLKTLFAGEYRNNNIRVKNRFSFKVNDHWRIDLTKVLSGYTLETLADKNESFELECEFIGGKVPFDDFILSMNKLYIMILKESGYC